MKRHFFQKNKEEVNFELKETKKHKKGVTIVVSIIILLLLIGGSYAAYRYNFLGANNLIDTESIELEFLESSGEIINLNNALPMSDKEGKEQSETFDFQVKTKTRSNIDITYGLYIEKLTSSTGYTFLNDNEVKIHLTDFNNNEKVAPVKISELNDYLLYSETNTHSASNIEQKDKYKLRIWIDEDVYVEDWGENTKLQYKFKIGVRAKEKIKLDKSGANAPVLSDNMIPVYYDETCNDNEGCWEKADSTNSNESYKWYDYDNKMWANSVTVLTNSEGVRTDLTEAPEGTEIPMDRILTMQVWIPRYKYTVWNYNSDGKVGSEPQQINIEFESGTTTTGEIECTDLENMGTSDGTKNGTEPTTSETCKIKAISATCTNDTCNGKTYTHPAFTFGNKELEGIWVGKFEVSSDTDCEPAYSSAIGEGCNLDTIRPLVKPDVASWRGAMVSIFENNMMAMNDTSNKYGFATTDDTHMMKNMEWGAVAYLTHSKYGMCDEETEECREINKNNSSNYYTGRSGGNVGGSTPINGTYTDQTSTTQYNKYGYYTYDGYLLEYGTNTKSETRDLSKVASTIGNIYGIYDMSGGADEYVMGNIVSPDGETMMSGDRENTTYPNQHSGYSGILYYNDTTSAGYGSYTGTYEYPENKYYDKYSFNTSPLTIGRSKLGDGIKEVYNTSYRGWYSDNSLLASSSIPWFNRGGDYFIASAGVFDSDNYYGFAYAGNSARLVISQ